VATVFRIVSIGLLSGMAAIAAARSQTPDNLPNPVKTCDDVRAYTDPDGSMPMERFKSLMSADGYDMTAPENQAYSAMLCDQAGQRKVTMVQYVKLGGAAKVKFTAPIVNEGGICKLATVTLDGCEATGQAVSLPNPVRTCKDVLAYVTDNAMPMERYEALLAAAGFDMNDARNRTSMETQCKAAAAVKRSILIQHIPTADEGVATFTADVVNDGGACQLMSVSISGPSCRQ
jgi:hypothetical protein